MTHELPKRALGFAILTVSDTRTAATDAGGDLAEKLARAAGHRVGSRAIAKDDVEAIRGAVRDALARDDVDAVVVTGGTGVSSRDVTPEALQPFFAKRLPGFGEAFRRLSFDEVGPAGLLSRADAGVSQGKPIFLLPGSPNGVRLAMERLVLPIAAHVRDLSSS